jgi:GH15 family glucan-1,4-alpha-glucosidase
MGSLVTRRSFLSLLAAPAIVHASNIMPVKVIPFDPYMLITGTDMLTNEIVERRIYEDASRADAFLSVDFLDKYERASALLTNINNAVVENRDQEKAMRFVAPSTAAAWQDQGPVKKSYMPSKGIWNMDTRKHFMVTPSDPEFYMNYGQLKEYGLHSVG